MHANQAYADMKLQYVHDYVGIKLVFILRTVASITVLPACSYRLVFLLFVQNHLASKETSNMLHNPYHVNAKKMSQTWNIFKESIAEMTATTRVQRAPVSFFTHSQWGDNVRGSMWSPLEKKPFLYGHSWRFMLKISDLFRKALVLSLFFQATNNRSDRVRLVTRHAGN